MTTMFDQIMATLIGVLGTALLGAIAYCIRLGTRISIQEALFVEKSKNVTDLDVQSNLHSNRITAIESVVPELRSLIQSLKDVPGLLSALKGMMENDRERLRDLEIRVTSTLQGPMGVQGPQGMQGQRGIPGNNQ